MSLLSLQASLISHPTTVYLTVSAFLAIFTLNPSPSFLSIITLVATLRLFVNTALAKQNSVYRLVLAAVLLSLSSTIANVVPSASALAHTHASTAAFALFALALVISSVVILTLAVEVKIRESRPNEWTKIILFPTLWATSLFVISTVSPLGRLATWTPVSDLSSYSWLRPFTGPSGIDWIVGAWATIISNVVELWVRGPEEDNK